MGDPLEPKSVKDCVTKRQKSVKLRRSTFGVANNRPFDFKIPGNSFGLKKAKQKYFDIDVL